MAILSSRRAVLVGGAATMALAATLSRAASSSVYPLKATRGERLLIGAKVNGTPVEALLDSGAELTFLDRAFAQQIGLVGNASATAKGSGKSSTEVPLAKGVTLRPPESRFGTRRSRSRTWATSAAGCWAIPFR